MNIKTLYHKDKECRKGYNTRLTKSPKVLLGDYRGLAKSVLSMPPRTTRMLVPPKFAPGYLAGDTRRARGKLIGRGKSGPSP